MYAIWYARVNIAYRAPLPTLWFHSCSKRNAGLLCGVGITVEDMLMVVFMCYLSARIRGLLLLHLFLLIAYTLCLKKRGVELLQ